VHTTALPCRADDPLDGGLQPFVRVRDHKLDAAQAASGQALEEIRPEGLGFRRADAEPDDLAPSFGVGATAIITAAETMRPPSRTFR
jgi:hypothetical protein